MPGLSKGDVVVVLYPFSDGSGEKPRPAVVVSDDDFNLQSPDVVLAQLTSRTAGPSRLGEHVLTDWQAAHLNVPSKVKAGHLASLETSEVKAVIGHLSDTDLAALDSQLRVVLRL